MYIAMAAADAFQKGEVGLTAEIIFDRGMDTYRADHCADCGLPNESCNCE